MTGNNANPYVPTVTVVDVAASASSVVETHPMVGAHRDDDGPEFYADDLSKLTQYHHYNELRRRDQDRTIRRKECERNERQNKSKKRRKGKR